MVRPPKRPEHKKSEYLQLRMTMDERASMQAGAKLALQPLSKFIRTAALEKAALLTQAAKRQTAGASPPPPLDPSKRRR